MFEVVALPIVFSLTYQLWITAETQVFCDVAAVKWRRDSFELYL